MLTMLDLNEYLNNDSNGIKWNIELLERINNIKCLEQYGFKVFSQNDEDGIIEEIFNRIGTKNKKFVEFGVQNGLESNGHYLLQKGWEGIWLECDDESYQEILTNFDALIKNEKLHVYKEFITKENINEIFERIGVEIELDLLSVDIDGNDFHVWEAIEKVNPRVVVIEYNAKFPPTCEWVMPYNKFHMWDGGDKHGASLLSLYELGKRKGYTLVGTNISGINAFFVRNDCKIEEFESLPIEQLYNPPRYYKRFYSGHPSKYCTANLPEGRCQLFAGKAEKVFFHSGFHLQEKESSIERWMSNENGKFFIKEENINQLIIDIFLPSLVFEGKTHEFELWIKVEGIECLNIKFMQVGARKVSINLEKIKKPVDGVYEVDIAINKTWIPCEHGIEDCRGLGILISNITYI